MLNERELDEIRQRDDPVKALGHLLGLMDALFQHIEEQAARITQLERQLEDMTCGERED